MMTHIASYANMYIITIKDFYMLQMPDVFSQQLSSIISMQVLHITINNTCLGLDSHYHQFLFPVW